IGKRPLYRVRHVRARYKKEGTPMKDSTYFEGNQKLAEKRYPRLEKNDPLAPIYENEAFVVRSQWQLRNADGGWTNCADLRSYPAKFTRSVYRVWEFSKVPN